jgi:hypothetical protein
MNKEAEEMEKQRKEERRHLSKKRPPSRVQNFH